MGKKILRTVLSCVLLMFALIACSNQADPSATEILQESNKPDFPNQELEPVAEPEIEEEPPVSVEAEATATTADILVNGNRVSIGAYNIDGSNYVSIRDLAYILDGSRVSFDVGWDAAIKSIALTSGQAYTPNGSELAENSGGKVSAWSIVTPVLLNGEEKMLDGYTVGNVSYFSLKEMSEALDFSMSWFNELRYIAINTEKSHDEEPLTLEEEYKLIVDSRAVYAPAIKGLCEASPGLCYADYIDFDNDGSVELLLVSVEKCWEEMGEEPILAMIEVYGASDGHAVPYGKFENEFPAGCYGDISITEYNSNKFVSISREWRRMSSDPLQSFYGVQDGALVLKEQIDSAFRATELNGGRTWFFYNMAGQEITEEQYRAIARQYVDFATILMYGIFENRDTYGAMVSDSGILSVPSGPTVVVNGKLVNFDANLYATDKRLIAPLTPVLDAMGIPVYSNAGGTVIVASTKTDSLSIVDGGWLMWRDDDDDTTNWGEYADNIKFNGELQTVSVEPVFQNGQLLVPISSFARMFGATVEWDEPARTLRISSDIPEKSRMSKEELDAMITGFTYEKAIAIAEQAGYIHTWNAYTIYDYFEYKNGKAFYIFYTIPVGVPEESTDLRYRTTVGSDGSITTMETTYDAENDI